MSRMSAPLVDFHCHLDLYEDYKAVIAETERAGIHTLAVTTTPRAWPQNRALTKGMRYVRPALGFHPQLVGTATHQELELWDRYLPEARYVGEVGLDAGPEFFRSLDQQRLIFEHVLNACAAAGGKVLSVHAIRSVSVVLDMVEALLPPSRGRVVLHWFTGTSAQARRAVDSGCYFSVNAPMLLSERGRALMRVLPPDRILTETDGPFTKHGDAPSKPGDVAKSIELLSGVLGGSPDVTSSAIATNLGDLLGERV